MQRLLCAHLLLQLSKLIGLCAAELEFDRSERAVRVNSLCSGLMDFDLGTILGADKLPDALVIPKVETVSDVSEVMDKLNTALGTKLAAAGRQLALITMCESARALLTLRYIHAGGRKRGGASCRVAASIMRACRCPSPSFSICCVCFRPRLLDKRN